MYGQQTIREGMQKLQERSAKDLFRQYAPSWMDLVHQLDSRTHGPASGYPLVVMVQPTHDRKSDHLVPCIPRGRNRSAPFRHLLLDPLMRSCLVEVGHIRDFARGGVASHAGSTGGPDMLAVHAARSVRRSHWGVSHDTVC